MKIKYLILILAAVGMTLVMTGCNKNDAPEAPVTSRLFLNKSVPGIYSGAKSIHVFTQTLNQLYTNKTTNTFRIVSHSGDEYVQIVLDGPVGSIGSKCHATVSNVGLGDKVPNYNNVEFEILKKESGYCWLWSDKELVGILLLYL